MNLIARRSFLKNAVLAAGASALVSGTLSPAKIIGAA